MVKKVYSISEISEILSNPNCVDTKELIVDRWIIAIVSNKNNVPTISFFNRNDRGNSIMNMPICTKVENAIVTLESFNEKVRVNIDMNNITFESLSYRWENLGDINYLSYGGSLVRDHWTFEELDEVENSSSIAGCYDVVYVTTSFDTGVGDNIVVNTCVDVYDTCIDMEGVLYPGGFEDKLSLSREELVEDMSPELLAREIVETGYGITSESQSSRMSDEELKKFLLDIGFEE